jgi:hypothetical protein
MPVIEPTQATGFNKSYLAWRITRYLVIRGSKLLLRLSLWLLLLTGRVILGLARLLSAPTPSYVNRARLSIYNWRMWRR